MRTTNARRQLALRWTADDDIRWEDLIPAMQAEVRELLRHLLVAAARAGRAETSHDE
jgi:hypothetical protein